MNTKVGVSPDLCNKPKKGRKTGAPLDTLAKVETKTVNDDFEISGSTSKTDTQVLLKRARRKYLASHLSVSITEYAKSVHSILEKSYRNSIYCCKTLTCDVTGKIKGNYCKTRWCIICNSIRTAKYINAYTPIITSWKEPYFVTLTEKNCKAEDLHDRITAMQSILSTIQKKYTKRASRKSDSKMLIGIRKLECTYNIRTDEYHPHFHFIVDCRNTAKTLHSEWLNRNDLAGIKGQDFRKADINSCMELFKYMTKILVKKSGSDDDRRTIHPPSLDVIFNAMRRRHTIQPFGFKKVPFADTLPDNTDCITEDLDRFAVEIYEWEQGVTDWVNVDTGELLTGYSPASFLRDIVESNYVVKQKEK